MSRRSGGEGSLAARPESGIGSLQDRIGGARADGRILHGLSRKAIAALAVVAALFLSQRPSVAAVSALYGLIAVCALLQWPSLGLVTLVLATALVPTEIETGTGSAVNVAVLGLVGLSALWFVVAALRRSFSLRPSAANLAWIAVIVAAVLSIAAGRALWSPWVVTKANFWLVQSAQLAVFGLSAMAFWLMGNTPRDERELEVISWVLVGLGFAFLVGHLPVFSGIDRIILLDGVVFRVWAVSLMAALALMHDGIDHRLRPALLFGALLIIAVAYLRSGWWQSGWVPPLAAFGTVVAVRLGRGLTRLAGLFSVPAAAVFLLFVVPRVIAREIWSFETRAIAWRGLIELLQGRWVFGLGLAAYWHYWRGLFGSMSYQDPDTGYLHFTYDPKVNMHNNYMDVLGQMGLVGSFALLWLILALLLDIRRGYSEVDAGFGRAYLTGAAGGLGGMLVAGMLGDWVFPFVYNIGIRGLRDSYLGWLMLGGVVLIRWSAAANSQRLPEGGR